MNFEETQDEKTDGDNVENSSVSTTTFDFSEKSWRTDFTLIVEGQNLYVSKAVLAIASPVFERMFQSSFQESSPDTLELAGKKLDDVLEFLRCIYPNTVAQVTSKNALQILPLVEEYQALQLKPRCEEALLEYISETTSAEELLMILKVAALYNMSTIINKCTLFASEMPKTDLEEAEKNNPVPSEYMLDIYQRSTARLENMVKELMENASGLEEKIEEITKINAQLEKWKSSLLAYINKPTSKSLILSNKFDWSGKTFVLDVDVSEIRANPLQKHFVPWDCGFNVVITVGFQSPIKITVKMERKIARHEECFIRTQYVVVNQLHPEQSVSEFFENILNTKQKTSFDLAAGTTIEGDRVKGCIRNGKLQLIVNVFVSKPGFQVRELNSSTIHS